MSAPASSSGGATPSSAGRVPTERSEAGVSRPHADKGHGLDTFPRTSETLDRRVGVDQRVPADRSSITATVSLDAIAHNVRVLRDHARGARVMPVVKANGYGHGAVEIARATLAAGADEIGVATIDEALALRAAGVDAPVLAWLHSSTGQFAEAAAADIALGISSIEQARAVRAIAQTASRPIRVDLKVDTGLSRGGAPASDWPLIMDELALAEAESGLRVRGVFSHLACADEPGHPSIDAQAALFREAIALAHAHGLAPTVNHLSNSAATLTRPDLAFDLVRPGLASYGLSPVPALGDFGLRAALGLTARLALVKRVDAGAGVSYGHNWTATHATTLGLVPMGYADGVPRALSGRFSVRAGGVDYPAVGRICMDQFVVDLGTNSTDLHAGDEVTLLGSEPGDPTLQDWADTLDTISYELATLLRGRTRFRFV